MICPECAINDTKSTVHGGGCTSTCMGYDTFYDEDGRYHRHDPNTVSTSYQCSQGHKWTEARKSKCHIDGCTWNECHQ